MRRNTLILWIVASFLVFNLSIGSGTCERGRSAKEGFYGEIELFTDAITTIQSEYVDEVEPKDLIYGALEGMLSSLDPHSQFMDPDTYNEMKVETVGEFGGLGIEITIRDKLLTIITPLDDTPAHRAGLKAGDRIVEIDGESTRDITLLEAVKKLRGKPGTDVALTIMREGQKELLDFVITRDIIKIKSVKEATIIEDGIGYIRLAELQEKTPQDLEDALAALEKEGMDSLILDLRNNPGGLLNVAVKVADKFIPQGRLIVSTRGRARGQDFVFKSHARGTHPDYALVLLVNRGSASGSEIIAGAIQDNKRGILVGTKTFGKGSVQTVIPLKDGSALRLTTSKYFTPSGRSIHGEGISPDILVELEERVEEKAERPVDIFEKIEKEFEKIEKEKEKKVWDNQLARAIDILKGIKVYRRFQE